MADQLTPGQIAYEAYCVFGACVTREHSTPWSWLAPVEQAQWEAAAQAVLAQAGLLVLDLDPEETRDA